MLNNGQMRSSPIIDRTTGQYFKVKNWAEFRYVLMLLKAGLQSGSGTKNCPRQVLSIIFCVNRPLVLKISNFDQTSYMLCWFQRYWVPCVLEDILQQYAAHHYEVQGGALHQGTGAGTQAQHLLLWRHRKRGFRMWRHEGGGWRRVWTNPDSPTYT